MFVNLVRASRPDHTCHNTLEKLGFQPGRFCFRNEGLGLRGGATREALVSRSHPFDTRTYLGLALGLGPPWSELLMGIANERFAAQGAVPD